MFKVSPVSLQTFIDTPNCVLEDRVQYSTVHVTNIFCDGHFKLLIVWGLFDYTVIIGRTETLSPCIKYSLFW
jgi:hypothetical protein